MTQYSGVYTLQTQGQALTSGQWCTDPYYKNTTLLLHADGVAGGAQNNTFLDSSTNAFAITRNGNTTQGSFTPYGPTWSNYFPNSSYLTSTATAANLGSGNFTIEFWWNGDCSGYNGFNINTSLSSGASTWQLFIDGNLIYWQNAIGTSNLWVSKAVSINTGWHHIAVVRTSGVSALYVDGVSVGLSSGSFTDGNNYSNASALYIGRRSDAVYPIGYFSNFRIATTAVYSGNFTPSTVPLTAITGTTILTCQSNSFSDSFLSSALMYYQTSASSTAAFSSANVLGYLPTSGASQQLYDLDLGSSVTTFVASYSSSWSGVSILVSADGTTWTTLYASGSQANTTLTNGGTPFRYVRWWYSGGTWSFGLSNRTLTISGTPSVQRFSPFAPQYQYTPAVIGGSGYFDGSGDYLSLARNSAFLPGASTDFTIEAWVYPSSIGAQGGDIIGMGEYGDRNNTDWVFVLDSAKTVTFYLAATNLARTTTATVTLNAWNHVAVCRSGTGSNNLTIYVNGVGQTFTETGAFTYAGSSALTIGSDVNGDEAVYAGYMSNVRMINGTCIYSGLSITVPTAPLTAVTNTSLLLSMTNAGIYDNAMMNNLETVGNAQVSTSVVKYGSGSMYFDGVGDYLKIPATPSIQLGTAPFTVEFWFNTNAITQYTAFVSSEGVTGGGFTILINSVASNGIIQVYNGASGLINATTLSYRDSAWHHLALVRDVAGSRLYIDGVQSGVSNSGQASTNFDNTTPQPFIIGTSIAFSPRDYIGYIDDLRITKGVARYTANFQPPKVAFANQ